MAKFDAEQDLEDLQRLRSLLDTLGKVKREYLRMSEWSDEIAARFDETRGEAARLKGRLLQRIKAPIISMYGQAFDAFSECLGRSLIQIAILRRQLPVGEERWLACLDAAKHAVDEAIGGAEGEICRLGGVTADEYLRVRWFVRPLLRLWDVGGRIVQVIFAQPGRWWERVRRSWLWQAGSAVVAIGSILGIILPLVLR